MKTVLATLLSLGFLFSICYAGEKLELEDQRNKESYSLGYQFGQNLKLQGLDLNLDVYTSGIKDFLDGKQPAMTQEEMQTAMAEMQRKFMAVREKELKEVAARNLGPNLAFLEENKKKEGVKVLPSGLQYKVLTEGSGKSPKATDTVTIHDIGTLINGTEVDNSYKRGQSSLVQVNGVLPGLSEALLLMKEGSKWQIFIPPTLAYGERGMGPVPPNSAVIYEIELVAVN